MRVPMLRPSSAISTVMTGVSGRNGAEWNWESSHQDPAVQLVDDNGTEQAISSTDPSALPFGKPGGDMRGQLMSGHWLPGKLDPWRMISTETAGQLNDKKMCYVALFLEIEHRMASRPAIPAELRRKVQVERGQPYCPRLPRLAPLINGEARS